MRRLDSLWQRQRFFASALPPFHAILRPLVQGGLAGQPAKFKRNPHG